MKLLTKYYKNMVSNEIIMTINRNLMIEFTR